MSGIITTDKPVFEIEIDSNVYSLDSCKKAAYALMAKCTAKIELSANNKINITVIPIPTSDLSESELTTIILDEVLDYSLRESIRDQTSSYRDIILSNAFSNTKLIG